MLMPIDLPTLAFIHGIINILQVLVLVAQYRINKTHQGTGWLALGQTLLSVGFVFNLLRHHPNFGLIAIVSNNILFLGGFLFIHTGFLRFMDQREQCRPLLLFFTLAILITIYFTYIQNDLTIRRINISVAIALVCFLIVRSLWLYKKNSFTTSARFLIVVFLINGGLFSLRAITPLMGGVNGGLFSDSEVQVTTFMVTLITSTLWIFGFILMVNQRLTAEIQESKEELELFFNTNPDSVLVTRLDDGYILSVNDGFSALFGFSRSEVIGKTALELNIWKNPKDRQKTVETLKDKGKIQNLEFQFQSKDGSHFIGIMSARIINLQGNPHIISVTHDITRRKQVEEALQQSEARYRLISENAADVIWTMDPYKGQFTYVSPSVKKLRGYTPEEIMVQPVNEALTPESQKVVETTLREGMTKFLTRNLKSHITSTEVDQPCKDGSIVNTEVTTNIVRNSLGDVEIIGVSRDITNRKLLQKQLEQKTQLMEAELHLAAEFQKAVLPSFPQVSFLNFYSLYLPSREVSGDLYDFSINRDGAVNVFIGDATGHGISAAFMTMITQIGLDSISPHLSTNKTLQLLNRLLFKKTKAEKAVTGIYLRIFPEGRLQTCNAGHPGLILLPADGSPERSMKTGGLPLGMFDNPAFDYQEESDHLMPGDRIFLYTDGITEWQNLQTEQFGRRRLIRFLKQHQNSSLQELSEHLISHLKKWSPNTPWDDDITLLCFEYSPAVQTQP
ncbi:MAG: PAS domain S-box protein [SAR324 cluster bacterium]|nr:PAS domain S-box protein [SAR324 cluster bacterium]